MYQFKCNYYILLVILLTLRFELLQTTSIIDSRSECNPQKISSSSISMIRVGLNIFNITWTPPNITGCTFEFYNVRITYSGDPYSTKYRSLITNFTLPDITRQYYDVAIQVVTTVKTSQYSANKRINMPMIVPNIIYIIANGSTAWSYTTNMTLGLIDNNTAISNGTYLGSYRVLNSGSFSAIQCTWNLINNDTNIMLNCLSTYNYGALGTTLHYIILNMTSLEQYWGVLSDGDDFYNYYISINRTNTTYLYR